MARRSQWEKFKSAILAEFAAGNQPKAIYSKYSQVPKTTIRNWYADFILNNSAPDSASNLASDLASDREPNFESDFSEPSDPPPPRTIALITTENTDVPDIKSIKRELWKHIKRPQKESAVIAQLANVYLRAIETENKLKSQGETTAEGELTTDEERAERIAEILELARERRTRQSAQPD